MKFTLYTFFQMQIVPFIIRNFSGTYGEDNCISPQYLERGSMGIIHCSFLNAFYGVLWYNTTDVENFESVVSFVESVKNGKGFLTEEYDIRSDGSLIIKNVSLKHETNFTVLKLDTRFDSPSNYFTINVVITVTPSHSYPVVEGCSYGARCILEVPRQGELTCMVAQVRPRLLLEWEVIDGAVSLSDQEFNLKEDEDIFNVSLSSFYRVNDPIRETITVRCTAFHPDFTRLDRSTLVTLMVVHGTLPTEYPVVKGCKNRILCLLEVPREGELTCKLFHVNPRSFLEWKQVNGVYSVIFYDHQFIVEESDGDSVNISLTSKYLVHGPVKETITVACYVFHPDFKAFNQSTVVAIKINDDLTNGQTDARFFEQIWIIIILLASISLLVLGITTVIIAGSCKRRNSRLTEVLSEQNKEKLRDIDTEGNISALKEMEAQKEPLLTEDHHDKGWSDKKKSFVEELKSVYKELYNAVQPVPYIRDRRLCVGKVFVEVGVQILDPNQNVGNENEWQNLDSYRDIFSSYVDGSNRKILEADAGYGKSTLALQFAHEWCNIKPKSFMETVEILILLRLRQLGGVPSFYGAIKQCLLPKDSKCSENDVERIISSESSVVIILDGFDEFPDRQKENDIMQIIQKKMFQNILVVLTTRSSCLPNEYPPSTERFRLTGFDDQARNDYITRAVVSNDDKDANDIQDIIHENAIIRDLCEVPLFFFMFVHMSHENKVFQKVYSVTSFFKGMIACFHSRLENKMKSDKQDNYAKFATQHTDLNKLAFEGLTRQERSIVWNREVILGEIGKGLYEYYVRVGILVEEDILQIEKFQYITQVRFYHKIFCEWYAAHHLSNVITTKDTAERTKLLLPLDPSDLQYFYRFSCGLNPNESNFIVDYLSGLSNFDAFAKVCLLEQKSNEGDKVKGELKKLFSRKITIKNSDTLLRQRSFIQLLGIASNNKIPITHVKLVGGISSPPRRPSACLYLKSQLSVPVLRTLKEFSISFRFEVMSKEKIENILCYVSLCSLLEKLEFQYNLMPKVIEKETLKCLHSKNLEVKWCPRTETCYILDLQSCTWKIKDKEEVISDKQYEQEKEILEAQRRKRVRRQWSAVASAVTFFPH